MGMYIDKTRTDDKPVGVNLPRRRFANVTHRDYATVLDANVAAVTRRTGTINNGAAGNFDIQGHHISRCLKFH